MSLHGRRLRVPAVVLCILWAAPAPAPAPTPPDRDRAGPTAVAVTFVVAVPEGTPPQAEVYLAGDFQGWQPGDPAYRLARGQDGRYRITLDLPADSPLAFKFTRGHWGVVEKGPLGQEIPNRTLTVAGPCTRDLAVAAWAQGPPPTPRASSRSGDLRTFTDRAVMGGRRLWVYLPAGYDREADRRYPVLYMLDGQNLFDAVESFAGEWQVDETCERLIGEGAIRPVIVVGIDNGGRERLREYTPWPDPARGGGGGADAHLDDIVRTLLPWIASRYRVLDGPAHTGLAGSSLGGLLALYGGLSRHDVFGLVAAFSPSLGWAGHRLTAWTADAGGRPDRLYLDMGEWESGGPQDEDGNGVADPFDDLDRLQGALQDLGFAAGRDLLVVKESRALHNESAWARRLPSALRFLYPPAAAEVDEGQGR